MAKAKKKLITQIKLQIPAGAATPAPPVGPALGQHGLNIQEFVTKFNAASQAMKGDILPVIINVYEGRTYDFIMKKPPASNLIKKALKIESGAHNPLMEKVGTLTDAQLTEIAKIKMPDLNTTDIEAAKRIIAGTARQMGVLIKE
ncbi:MAG: 50S ribosomal protein L11 [Patescibacteria group bacterium]|nr:50S ribosomal protein L11 [Patescibacteria group bacterium]